MRSLTQKLPREKFDAMVAELRAISAAPTLDQTRAIMAKFGVTSPTAKDGQPSKEAARTLLRGPFKRYIERLNAGREACEQLCAAAGAGVHPLDALEEAMTIELHDHVTGAEDGKIDLKFVCDRIEQLRGSISQRENSRRQQADLERKQRETAAKLDLAEQREALLKEQVARYERQKADWEKQRADAKAALAAVVKKGGITADTRKLIEQAMGGEAP